MESSSRSRSAASIIDHRSQQQQQQQKKPRLLSTTAAAAAAEEDSSSTLSDRGDRNSSRGGSNNYQQQQQELVAQYKTALSELTFNSKPIITNLTIIAGENLHAAKGITATICSNILEVPSEQKLPSLYLLDSIVKNIGRDYIKYFGARLPEVFCKAYKQVDSSIHPGMRHLFGTWKGVFPAAPLQIIEKELNFPPVINGSSGTTALRSDSQQQRTAPSIHVNPKYLEARQRFQQSTRAKDISNDDMSSAVTPIDDAERSDRTAFTGNTRQWTDLSSKANIQRPQREQLNDPYHDKKGFRDVKNHDSSSDFTRQSDLGVSRINERIKERDDLDKSYYGVGSTSSEMATSRRNGFDANHGYGNYRPSGFAQADRELSSVHLNNTNKSSRSAPKNWKNSEEEEYMWDDMNSKLTDYGGTNSSIKVGYNVDNADKAASLKRRQWVPIETEQLDFHRDKLDTFSRLKTSEGEERVPLLRDIDDHHLQPRNQQDTDSRKSMETPTEPLSLGRPTPMHHSSSLWPHHEPPLSVVGLNQMSSKVSHQPDAPTISLTGALSTNLVASLPRAGLLSHSHPSSLGPYTSLVSGSSGMFGQQRQQPLQPPSPPAHSSTAYVPLQHKKLHNLADYDHPQPPSTSQMGQKPLQLPGHFGRAPQASVTIDSFSMLGQNDSQQSHILHNFQPPQLLPPQPSLAPFTQSRNHSPFLQQGKQSQIQSQLLNHTEKPPMPSQNSETQQSCRFSSEFQSNNLIEVSGQSSTSSSLAANVRSGIVPNNTTNILQNINIQPPLPSGPPPVQVLTSSVPLVTPPLLPLPTSQGNTPALTAPLMRPPLPPGPPPPSSVGISSQKSNTTSAVSNPFSVLINSLVAKGLITSPATELPAVTSAQLLNKVEDQSTDFACSIPVLVPSISATSIIPPFPGKDLSESEPSVPAGDALLQHNTTELEDLIGVDFKPEIIRELHPLVISSLFDDLKYQCDLCGLRFKLQEQINSHLDFHASEKSLPVSNFDEVARKWYSNIRDWVSGSRELSLVPVPTSSFEEAVEIGEKCESMVPADESQCICALCGEPFEDIYSHERDEWMYKDTVFLKSLEGDGDRDNMDESTRQVFIVHEKCMSRSADTMERTEQHRLGPADGLCS